MYKHPLNSFFLYLKTGFCLLSIHSTGVTGLKRGLATFPQGSQEPLSGQDKDRRPPGELGVSKSVDRRRLKI